jgi:hypothetical protein
MKPFRIKLGKCRVIFFDLEFYVPEKERDKTGFCYNPWDKSCKFLGGSFLAANPDKDLSNTSRNIEKKVQSLWLWNYKSERELLEKIYQLLKSTSDIVREAHDGKVSPILCGIGITSSDIPILFELFKRYQILTNKEAFYFQNGFRVIDISQLSIATFNNGTDFLYPKTKNLILKKYLPGKKFENGKKVWDMYDSKAFNIIESRVIDEVMCTHECYIKILSDIRKFKILESNDKKQKKLLAKQTQE